MRNHHKRLDRIESAASPDREPIHVVFSGHPEEELPPEAKDMEEPVLNTTTGEWEDAALRTWHDSGPVRVSFD